MMRNARRVIALLFLLALTAHATDKATSQSPTKSGHNLPIPMVFLGSANEGDLRTLFCTDDMLQQMMIRSACLMGDYSHGLKEYPVADADTVGSLLKKIQPNWAGSPQVRLISQNAITQSPLPTSPTYRDEGFLGTPIKAGDLLIFTAQD